LKRLIWAALLFWAMSQFVHYILWIGYSLEYRQFLTYFPLFHLNSFVLGMLGGIWYLKEGQSRRVSPAVVVAVLGAGVILFAGYVVASTLYYPSLPGDPRSPAGLLAPFISLVVVGLALDTSRISIFFNSPVLVSLGHASYAIYILHVPLSWLYERLLGYLPFGDPQFLFGLTFLPLIVIAGWLSYYYIDSAVIGWLKRTLEHVSLRLLVIDLGLVAISIYLSFRIRFGEGREFNQYWETAQIMFWTAFILRTILSTYFKNFDPASFCGTFFQLAKPVLLSVTVGSLLTAGMVYLIFSFGLIENFPRSIILIDWGIVSVVSLLIRFVFRKWKVYQPQVLTG
jgi:hypothetical protein